LRVTVKQEICYTVRDERVEACGHGFDTPVLGEAEGICSNGVRAQG
jgi:hypothetical protein